MRARGYELTAQTDVATFVAWMILVAPNFDESPEIREILTDESVLPEDRVADVVHRATEETWQRARDGYRERAWGWPWEGEP